ncbi:MAG: PfkB family carbohydrate kinase [Treponema sp.]|nr:PfkB family carbohydrate kinase [Treponema sp.]
MFLTICLNPTIQKTLRFPSITPNTVNRTAFHRLDASGKGINVTRVLTQLGKKAVHLTQLGGDFRPLFLSLCEQDGLSVEWVESNTTAAGETSGRAGEIRFCYTVLNENDKTVTELVEESRGVAAGTEERLLEKFISIIGKILYENTKDTAGRNDSPDTIIISGTKAAGFSDFIIPEMTRKAKENGLRIILDIKGNDLIESLKYEPDIIKPNLEEFLQTFGIGTDKTRINADYDDLRGLVLELAQKHKCRIVLTNANKKIIAAEKDSYFEIDVPVVNTVNSTGCGDAFTAGFAAALENGADFKTAINEGMRCGALNAGLERPGTIR